MQVGIRSSAGTVTLDSVGGASVAYGPAPLPLRDASRYEVLGEHGRGGLGRILRARDKELGCDVAIKELIERSEAAELRFFCEALITASLEHPNIISVHDAGRWSDGTPFSAADAGSLGPRKRGPLWTYSLTGPGPMTACT